jgi:hypothetical protein
MGCHLWGAALFHGAGGARDHERARELQEKACAAEQPGACFLAGIIWGGGHGGDQNTSVARDYFEKACALGDERGCEEVSWIGNTWLLTALGGSLVIGLLLAVVCLRKRGPGPGAFVGAMIPFVALNIMAFTIDALRFVWFPFVVGAAAAIGGMLGKKYLFRKESVKQ